MVRPYQSRRQVRRHYRRRRQKQSPGHEDPPAGGCSGWKPGICQLRGDLCRWPSSPKTVIAAGPAHTLASARRARTPARAATAVGHHSPRQQALGVTIQDIWSGVAPDGKVLKPPAAMTIRSGSGTRPATSPRNGSPSTATTSGLRRGYLARQRPPCLSGPCCSVRPGTELPPDHASKPGSAHTRLADLFVGSSELQDSIRGRTGELNFDVSDQTPARCIRSSGCPIHQGCLGFLMAFPDGTRLIAAAD